MSDSGAPRKEDLTRGSIPRHLLRLAAPAGASAILHNLYAYNDLFFAGRVLGDKYAAAAIGACLFVAIFTFAFSTMVTAGTLAVVSRLTGAGERRSVIVRQVRHGIVLTVLAGVVVGAALLPLVRPIMRFMSNGDHAVTEAGVLYLRGILIGLPVIFLMSLVDSLFRSRGTAVVPLVMEIFTVVANVALNAFTVLVLKWGVAGIAVATVGSRLAGASIGLALIARGGLRLPVRLLPPERPDPESYRRILRIGFPAGMRPALFATVFMVVTNIVSRVGGPDALGGLTVGIRIEGFCFLIMLGFGLAVSPTVGQNLGARAPDRAQRAANTGALLAGVAGLVLGTLFFVFPRELMSTLTTDEAQQELGAVYLRIVAICQVFTALEIAYGQAFIGAGDTIPPLIVSTAFTVMRIPGAWLGGMVFGGGVLAIWWVINVTAILRGIGMWAWFRRGHWKSRRLPDARR